ncbi:hypothetical protein DFH09DRAFT_1098291 [Mycena vulgaris]|nr:hypothetical protein DFH09DRAFT_1098291 [Mycena vulgaris]
MRERGIEDGWRQGVRTYRLAPPRRTGSLGHAQRPDEEKVSWAAPYMRFLRVWDSGHPRGEGRENFGCLPLLEVRKVVIPVFLWDSIPEIRGNLLYGSIDRAVAGNESCSVA